MAWIKIENDLDNIVVNIVDDEIAQEGLGKLMTFGTLIFLLGTSGLVNASELKSNLERTVKDKRTQSGKVTITNKEIAKAVKDSRKRGADEKVGNWEKAKAVNVVARTLYGEARSEGDDGLNMVMTVIWNRAGGNADNLADICLKPLQFSCWNSIQVKTPSAYSIHFPKEAVSGNRKEMSSWNACVSLATSAFNGTFKPVNSSWNAYYNPDKASPDWADDLVGAKMVGHHKVGELTWITKKVNKKKISDAHKEKPSTYTVKKGDSLWRIAKANKTTVQNLKKLNGLTSDVIKPGQKLNIPD